MPLPAKRPELNPAENVWSSCATTGCQTGFSGLMTTSSTIAAKPGTSSSRNPGASCPSECANGRTGSNHGSWYKVMEKPRCITHIWIFGKEYLKE
jgi:hypothetical protein